MKLIDRLFGADLRTLVLFRIALGGLILADLAIRLPNLTAHYSDAGVLPRAAWGAAHRWWPHFWSGSAAFEAGLFVLAALVAAALAMGVRPRLAACLSWALLLSLHARNPLVLQGGDVLLRLMLFWAVFLPLGGWRVDSTGSPQAGENPQVVGGATAAYFFQIAFVYGFTAAHKSAPEWADGSAVYYALNLDTMAGPLAGALLRYPGALELLTRAVWIFEAALPLVLFFPLFTLWARLAAVLAVWAMQIGFGLAFNIGLFPWIAAAAMLPFLPSQVWGERRPSPARRLSGAAGAAALVFLALVLWWNCQNFPGWRWVMPPPLKTAVHALGLSQRWKMFAPAPSKNDGWIVARGTTVDGQRFDLMRGGEAVSWKKPASLPKYHRDYRWRQYLGQIVRKRYTRHQRYFAQYLSRSWKRQYPDAPLRKIELFWIWKKTPADPRQTPECVRVRLAQFTVRKPK